MFSLFMAVSTASFFSLVLISETPCFRVSLNLFQLSCSQFKPLQFSWALQGLGLQQLPSQVGAGREDPFGLQKAQGSWLSLGWCSMSSPPNTGSTAGTGRVSVPQMSAMAFLLGIWKGHRLLFPTLRELRTCSSIPGRHCHIPVTMQDTFAFHRFLTTIYTLFKFHKPKHSEGRCKAKMKEWGSPCIWLPKRCQFISGDHTRVFLGPVLPHEWCLERHIRKASCLLMLHSHQEKKIVISIGRSVLSKWPLRPD